MKRKAQIITLATLALIGAAAAFLGGNRGRQHLGEPGVRVAARLHDGSAKPGSARVFLGGTNCSIVLPERVRDYASVAEEIDRPTLEKLPQDTTFGRRLYFRREESPILCQVVLMGADRTSIHKPQFCLKGMGLSIVSGEVVRIPVTRPHRYDLPVMRLNVRGQKADGNGNIQTFGGVYVYWFVADGELTASHAERVWWLARDMLKSGVLQRWAYVVCYKPCLVGGEDAAFEQMKEFIAAAVPEFQRTAGPPAADVAAK